jgi:2-oxoglutarate dehydrogenase E2 component (dihydrolipoamide succinyltransferase)
MDNAKRQTIEVRVPPLPESVSDGLLSAWHKQPGEPVRRDENLVDLETDKVVLEIPAPLDGVLREVLKEAGTTVRGEELIALIEPGAGAPEPAKPGASAAAGAPAAAAAAQAQATAAAEEQTEEQVGPAVRRLLAEHRLDASQIPATGRGGRITKEDVLNYLQEREEARTESERQPQAAPPAAAPAAEARPSAPAPAPRPTAERPERRVPMTRLRARIAERLVQAQQTAAILTTFNEVDMRPVMELRKRYRDAFEKQHGARLGMMSFFVKASVEALRRFPVVNAGLEGSDIVYRDYYDIGIAVAAPRGLVVPILRDCDRLSFAEIERGIADYGHKAREGTLSIEDLTGGTFSISNGGIFGSLLSTPILNPPQSAILGMHKIQDRPVVGDGEIRIRPMMYLALSYDHRLIDGREAVQFLVTVKECLEEPARLLLEV